MMPAPQSPARRRGNREITIPGRSARLRNLYFLPRMAARSSLAEK